MTTDVFRNLDVVLAGVTLTGVVHAGAHRGQEVADYRRVGFGRIVLVEPNPALWPVLDKIAGVTVFQCAVGAAGDRVLHVTGWDERSSLLAPVDYPVVAEVEVPVRPLAVLQEGCNVAVVDVQGSEVDVLATADLALLDVVIVETSETVRYRGGASRADVAGFMTGAGWTHHGDWGGHSPGLVDQVWRSP